MPSVSGMPAELVAMAEENGLIVEKHVPTDPARKMAPTTTMES